MGCLFSVVMVFSTVSNVESNLLIVLQQIKSKISVQ